jgi:PKD repeat protein
MKCRPQRLTCYFLWSVCLLTTLSFGQRRQANPRVSLTAAPTRAQVTQNIHFVGSLSTANLAHVTYRFDWGDGSQSRTSPESVADHRYARPGIYKVVLHAQAGTVMLSNSAVQVEVYATPAQQIATTTIPKLNASVQQVEKLPGKASSAPTGQSAAKSASAVAVVTPAAKSQQASSGTLDGPVQPPRPQASLRIEPNTAQASINQTLQFTGILEPAIDNVSYRFNWGDGTSTAPLSTSTANHSYSKAGTYKILLVAEVGRSLVARAVATVRVKNPRRSVWLQADRENAEVNQSVHFVGGLRPPVNGRSVRYQFNWGDGSKSEVLPDGIADHAYTSPGTYSVVLTAVPSVERFTAAMVNPAITSPVLSIQVHLPQSRVYLDASPRNPQENQSVHFVGTLEPARKIKATYLFNWGDATTSGPLSSSSADHSYARSGRYQVVLQVQGLGLSMSSPPLSIQVQAAPVSRLSLRAEPSNPQVEDSVHFSGQLDPPATDRRIRYQFDWGDGTRSEWMPTSFADHGYTSPRTYTVVLLAQIGDGIVKSPPTSVYVRRSLPSEVYLRATPTPAKVNESVHFIGSLQPSDSSQHVTYSFDWGDGTNSGPLSTNVEDHVYNQPGNYNVVVKAAVGKQTLAGAPLFVRVMGAPPGPPSPPPSPPPPPRIPSAISISLTAEPENTQVKQMVQFSGRIQPPHLARNASYEFDWGDGTRSGLLAASVAHHRYSAPGTYKVRLRVLTGQNSTQSSPVTVYIYKLKLAAGPAHQSWMRGGVPIIFTATLAPPSTGAEYRFDFGDGQQSGWTPQSAVEYRYLRSGSYRSSVLVRRREDSTEPFRSNEISLGVIVPTPGWVWLTTWTLGGLSLGMGARQLLKYWPKLRIKVRVSAPAVMEIKNPHASYAGTALQIRILSITQQHKLQLKVEKREAS